MYLSAYSRKLFKRLLLRITWQLQDIYQNPKQFRTERKENYILPNITSKTKITSD